MSLGTVHCLLFTLLKISALLEKRKKHEGHKAVCVAQYFCNLAKQTTLKFLNNVTEGEKHIEIKQKLSRRILKYLFALSLVSKDQKLFI